MKRREFLKIAAVSVAAGIGGVAGEAEERSSHGGSGASLHPIRLRCENRVNPLGIDTHKPRLSWMAEAAEPGVRGLMQSAYQIQAASSLSQLRSGKADLWDSGKVASDQSIQIPYRGRPLASRELAWWRARVWDQDERISDWSETAQWSMGLLDPADWEGKWVGLDHDGETPEEFRGAAWISGQVADAGVFRLRKMFEVSADRPVSYGLLAMAGTPELSIFINGKRIKPGSRLPSDYIVATVTDGIHPGNNIIAVELRGEGAAVIGSVILDFADGSVDRIQTGADWKASHVSRASEMESPDWAQPQFDDRSWAGAKPIAGPSLPAAASAGERTELPARMLRKAFHIGAAHGRAVASISGLGYYELYLNGRKISPDVLTPALADYDKRVFYRTYDVSPYLHSGQNSIGILLGNGRFYAPRRYVPFITRSFGYPKALFQLDIEGSDGKRISVVTDESWKITDQGPIRANNTYDGETYDARMEQVGWTQPDFDDSIWRAVEVVDAPTGELTAQKSEPIHVMQTLKPVKLVQRPSGAYVFDMGQNMVGWCRLRVTGPRGARITLRHAEVLRPDGELSTDNLRSARQTDTYILKGGGEEVYEPRFTSHGFRYVELRGYPAGGSAAPSLTTLTGCVVHDSLEEHIDFATSNEILNQIHRNVIWGDRGNYHSVPTDCPQRDERQGWLGDRLAESRGETYLFGVSSFYEQWLEDIADSINANGVINDLAPAYWPMYNENVVWPACYFVVAAMLWRQYGDTEAVRRNYPVMRRWVEHMLGFIQDDLMPIDVYGDWCVPPRAGSKEIHSTDPRKQTSSEVLGSCYFYHLLRLMSKFSVLSGHSEDKAGYDQLAAKMKIAFQKKYYRPESHQYDNGSQTSSVLPLALGLASTEDRPAIAKALVRNIETVTNGHVGTGLVGMQWLMQTLTRCGYTDVAYRMASETTYPGWDYMIRNGATTVWELWNGNTAAPGMNSRNHLMLVGDLCTWFYEDLAGIRADADSPGFKHILVRPHPASGLQFVRASHLSPYGKIAAGWERNGRTFRLNLSVPPNTSATVTIPTTDSKSIREGGHAAGDARGVSFVREMQGAAVYRVGSGEYSFSAVI